MANPVGALFDSWAKQGTGARMEEAHEYAGKKVLDRISIGYDESFIDVGCGNGWATRYIASKVQTIGLCVGIDASPEFIKEARALSASRYPIKFLASPVEDVPFGESSFNHAFSMEALYYTPDLSAALKSIWRVLKAGGTFHLVVDYFKENTASEAWQKDSSLKMHMLSEAEWVAALGAAGFAETKAERILDDRPVAPDMKMPWGGFQTREDHIRFRTEIGSLYLRGKKSSLSHDLDKVLERASAEIARDTAQEPAKTEARARRGQARKRR